MLLKETNEFNAFDISTQSVSEYEGKLNSTKTSNVSIRDQKQVLEENSDWRINIVLDIDKEMQSQKFDSVGYNFHSYDSKTGKMKKGHAPIRNIAGSNLPLFIKSTKNSPFGNSFSGRKFLSVIEVSDAFAVDDKDKYLKAYGKLLYDRETLFQTSSIVLNHPLLRASAMDQLKGVVQKLASRNISTLSPEGKEILLTKVLSNFGDLKTVHNIDRQALFSFKISTNESSNHLSTVGSHISVDYFGDGLIACSGDINLNTVDSVTGARENVGSSSATKSSIPTVNQVLLIPKIQHDENTLVDVLFIGQTIETNLGVSQLNYNGSVFYVNTTTVTNFSRNFPQYRNFVLQSGLSTRRRFYNEYGLIAVDEGQKATKFANLLKTSYMKGTKKSILKWLGVTKQYVGHFHNLFHQDNTKMQDGVSLIYTNKGKIWEKFVKNAIRSNDGNEKSTDEIEHEEHVTSEVSGLSQFIIELSKLLYMYKNQSNSSTNFSLLFPDTAKTNSNALNYKIKWPFKNKQHNFPNMSYHTQWIYPHLIKTLEIRDDAIRNAHFKEGNALPATMPLYCILDIFSIHNSTTPTELISGVRLDPYFTSRCKLPQNTSLMDEIVTNLTNLDCLLDKSSLRSTNVEELEKSVSKGNSMLRGLHPSNKGYKNVQFLKNIHMVVHRILLNNVRSVVNDGREEQNKAILFRVQAKLSSKEIGKKIGYILMHNLVNFCKSRFKLLSSMEKIPKFQELMRFDENVDPTKRVFAFLHTISKYLKKYNEELYFAHWKDEIQFKILEVLSCSWYAISTFVMRDLNTFHLSKIFDLEFATIYASQYNESDLLETSFDMALLLYDSIMDRLMESILYVSLRPNEKTGLDDLDWILKLLHRKLNTEENYKFVQLSRDLDGLFPIHWNQNELNCWKEDLLSPCGIEQQKFEHEATSYVSQNTTDFSTPINLNFHISPRYKEQGKNTMLRKNLCFPSSNGFCLIKECKSEKQSYYDNINEQELVRTSVGNPQLSRQYLNKSTRQPIISPNEWTPFIFQMSNNLLNDNSNYRKYLKKFVNEPGYIHTQKFLGSGKYVMHEANEYQIYDGRASVSAPTPISNKHNLVLTTRIKVRPFPLEGCTFVLSHEIAATKMLQKIDNLESRLLVDIKRSTKDYLNHINEEKNLSSSKLNNSNLLTPEFFKTECSFIPTIANKPWIPIEVDGSSYRKQLRDLNRTREFIKGALECKARKQEMNNSQNINPLDFKTNNEYQFEWHAGMDYCGKDSFVSSDLLCSLQLKKPKKTENQPEVYTLWVCFRPNLSKSLLNTSKWMEEASKNIYSGYDVDMVENFDVGWFGRPTTQKAYSAIQNDNLDQIAARVQSTNGPNFWKICDEKGSYSHLELWKAIENVHRTLDDVSGGISKIEKICPSLGDTMDYGLQPTILLRLQTVILTPDIELTDIVLPDTFDKLSENQSNVLVDYNPVNIWDLHKFPKFSNYRTFVNKRQQKGAVKSNLSRKPRDVIWMLDLEQKYPNGSVVIPVDKVAKFVLDGTELDISYRKYSNLLQKFSIPCNDADRLFSWKNKRDKRSNYNHSSDNWELFLPEYAGEYTISTKQKFSSGTLYNKSIFLLEYAYLEPFLGQDLTKLDLNDQNNRDELEALGYYDLYLIDPSINSHGGASVGFRQLDYRSREKFLYSNYKPTNEFQYGWSKPFFDHDVRSPLLNTIDSTYYALLDVVKSSKILNELLSPKRALDDWQSIFKWTEWKNINTFTALNSVYSLIPLTNRWLVENLKSVVGKNYNATVLSGYFGCDESQIEDWFKSWIDSDQTTLIPKYLKQISTFFQQSTETCLLKLFVSKSANTKEVSILSQNKLNGLRRSSQMIAIKNLVNPKASLQVSPTKRLSGNIAGKIQALIRLYSRDLVSNKVFYVGELNQLFPINQTSKITEVNWTTIFPKLLSSKNSEIILPACASLAKLFVATFMNSQKWKDRNGLLEVPLLYKLNVIHKIFEKISSSSHFLKNLNGRLNKIPSEKLELVLLGWMTEGRKTYSKCWKNFLDVDEPFSDTVIELTELNLIIFKTLFGFTNSEITAEFKHTNWTKSVEKYNIYKIALADWLKKILNCQFYLHNTKTTGKLSITPKLHLYSPYDDIAIRKIEKQTIEGISSFFKANLEPNSEDCDEIYYVEELIYETSKSAMNLCTRMIQAYRQSFNVIWSYIMSTTKNNFLLKDSMELVSKKWKENWITNVNLGSFSYTAPSKISKVIRENKELWFGGLSLSEWNSLLSQTELNYCQEESLKNVFKPTPRENELAFKQTTNSKPIFAPIYPNGRYELDLKDSLAQSGLSNAKEIKTKVTFPSKTQENSRIVFSLLERTKTKFEQDIWLMLDMTSIEKQKLWSQSKNTFEGKLTSMMGPNQEEEMIRKVLDPLMKDPHINQIETELALEFQFGIRKVLSGSKLYKSELLKILVEWNLISEELFNSVECAKQGEKNQIPIFHYPSNEISEWRSLIPSEMTFNHFLDKLIMPLFLEMQVLQKHYAMLYEITFKKNGSIKESTKNTPKGQIQLKKYKKKIYKLQSEISKALIEFSSFTKS